MTKSLCDHAARIAEIRSENAGGDVSFRDIEWLCNVALTAARAADDPDGEFRIFDLKAALRG